MILPNSKDFPQTTDEGKIEQRKTHSRQDGLAPVARGTRAGLAPTGRGTRPGLAQAAPVTRAGLAPAASPLAPVDGPRPGLGPIMLGLIPYWLVWINPREFGTITATE